jgi:hypothetical protein
MMMSKKEKGRKRRWLSYKIVKILLLIDIKMIHLLIIRSITKELSRALFVLLFIEG